MIYFDNAATAAPCPEAIDIAEKVIGEYGNPSSDHSAGFRAKKHIDTARDQVSAALRSLPEEIVFTSGGTEAANMAIFGIAETKNRHSDIFITTESEHLCVESSMTELERRGKRVVRVPTPGGEIDYERLEQELKDKKVAMLAVFHVNNETGAVNDLERIRRIVDRSGCGAVLFADGVQSMGRVAADVYRHCDLISFSSHKIGGLKGTGALVVRKGVRCAPLIYGGGQESGHRAGTENTIGIAAFGAAAAALAQKKSIIVEELETYLIESLKRTFDSKIVINLPKHKAAGILSVSLPEVRSETVMNYLSAKDIFVSRGSACSARAKSESRVLTAYGLSGDILSGSFRISLSHTNNRGEIDIFCRELRNGYNFIKGN